MNLTSGIFELLSVLFGLGVDNPDFNASISYMQKFPALSIFRKVETEYIKQKINFLFKWKILENFHTYPKTWF